MPQLNEAQKKKRGTILQDMFVIFMNRYSYLNKHEAEQKFIECMESDPRQLEIINALAASCTPKEEVCTGAV